MITYVLSSIFCLFNQDPCLSKLVQTHDLVNVYSTCYDVNTGVHLKVKAYASSGSGRLLLGESNDAGLFDFKMPASAKRLYFESKGFKSVSLPASVLAGIKDDSKFQIAIPMSAQDSLEIEPVNQLSLSFIMPGNIDVELLLRKIDNPVTGIHLRFTAGRHLPGIILKDVAAGDYILTVTSPNGGQLLSEEVSVGQGLTFKTVSIPKDEKVDPSDRSKSSHDFSLSATRPPVVLYFAQSSYELKNEVKASLDTISRYLLDQPSIAANITGYTDNVGERELNVTLSEYRARSVAAYLTRKGVRSTQLLSKRKGPDSLAILDDRESGKIKSRRVIIRFSR